MTNSIYIQYLSEQPGIEHYLNRLIKFLNHFISIEPFNKPKGFECHHIVPKSWKPEWEFEKDNLLKVPVKAHYVIHHLMWKAFPDDAQMIRAFWFMTGKGSYVKVSARVYETIKDLMSKDTGDRMRGVPKTAEQNKKNSDSNKQLYLMGLKKSTKRRKRILSDEQREWLSKNNVMNDPYVRQKHKLTMDSKEYREKLSRVQKKRYENIEEREKISKRISGQGNPMFNKKQERIRCFYCQKEVDKPNYSRWHGQNCKEKNNVND